MQGLRNLALDLFLALQNLPVAQHLPSPNSGGIILSDLSRFVSQTISTNVRPMISGEQSSPSSHYERRLLSPPMKPLPTRRLKSTSSSQQLNEQTHDEIDPRMLLEINGCVYNNTKGFYAKYFEGRSWSTDVEEIIRSVNPKIVAGHWTEYPSPPSQKAFLDWFLDFPGSVL
jgi:hypothetical protein